MERLPFVSWTGRSSNAGCIQTPSPPLSPPESSPALSGAAKTRPCAKLNDTASHLPSYHQTPFVAEKDHSTSPTWPPHIGNSAPSSERYRHPSLAWVPWQRTRYAFPSGEVNVTSCNPVRSSCVSPTGGQLVNSSPHLWRISPTVFSRQKRSQLHPGEPIRETSSAPSHCTF